jgi:hypothetical protein
MYQIEGDEKEDPFVCLKSGDVITNEKNKEINYKNQRSRG